VAMVLLGVVVLALGLGHADIVAPWRLTFPDSMQEACAVTKSAELRSAAGSETRPHTSCGAKLRLAHGCAAKPQQSRAFRCL
jgi:hypothetical protein